MFLFKSIPAAWHSVGTAARVGRDAPSDEPDNSAHTFIFVFGIGISSAGVFCKIGETGSVLASRVPRWRRVRTPAAPAARSVEKAACVSCLATVEGTRAAAAAEESSIGDMTFPPAGSPAFFDLRTMDAPTTPAIRSASVPPRTSRFVINRSTIGCVIWARSRKTASGSGELTENEAACTGFATATGSSAAS